MENVSPQSLPYRGPERRRHCVYRTLNSEYYCLDNVCVAVRDRKTGEFVPDHRAIGLRMSGGIRFSRDGEILSFSQSGEVPQAGEVLFFSRKGDLEEGVRTSTLTEVTRPPRSS